MVNFVFSITGRILIVIAGSLIIGGCKPEQTDNGGQLPPVVEPEEGSDHEHPMPDPPDEVPPLPPVPDPVPPAPDPVPPTPPDDPKPPPVPDQDPSEPNWDSATRVEIKTGEFVYDPDGKIWLCYSRDTSSVVWKIAGTGKYPLPKELDAEAICDCCGYHGVKVTLMIPKEWDDPPTEQEKGRAVKRAVVVPTGDTTFDGPGCGGTCSCHDEEKK